MKSPKHGTHRRKTGENVSIFTIAANRAVTQADVIWAVGARFDDHVTGKLPQFVPNARIVHSDIDPATLRKNVTVEIKQPHPPTAQREPLGRVVILYVII
ncbi:hypothetical protein [uncultured Bilophila sp.]|uniref:hypothetical protein n=1 Tax=uncultured Bilophila sp. TaxID=529385 RepID=UPI0035A64A5E